MVIMLVGRAVRQRHCRGSRSFAAGDGMARSQGVRLRFLLRRMASARLLLGQIPRDQEEGYGVPVPYGIAIAGAALIVTLQPHLG